MPVPPGAAPAVGARVLERDTTQPLVGGRRAPRARSAPPWPAAGPCLTAFSASGSSSIGGTATSGSGSGSRRVTLERSGSRRRCSSNNVSTSSSSSAQRPGRGAHARQHGAQHRRQPQHRALGDLAVLAAPLRDRVERVEEEVRIQVGAQRQQLRALRLAGQQVVARLRAREALSSQMSRPRPQPPTRNSARQTATLVGAVSSVRPIPRMRGATMPSDQHHARADRRVQHQADAAVAQVEPIGEQHPPRHRRDDHEAHAHRDPQRDRQRVAAVAALRDHQRRRQQHDRDQPRGCKSARSVLRMIDGSGGLGGLRTRLYHARSHLGVINAGDGSGALPTVHGVRARAAARKRAFWR